MNKIPYSFIFKDAIPNLASFESCLDNVNVDYVNDPLMSKIKDLAFNLLYSNYQNSGILYDVIDEFKNQFSNQLYVSIYQLAKDYQLTMAMYDIPLNDLAVVSSAIHNYAQNNNELAEEPLEVLKYITSQNASISKANLMQAYATALSTFNTRYVDKFINSFAWLFRRIFVQGGYYYEKAN